jgi:hypothetical protein
MNNKKYNEKKYPLGRGIQGVAEVNRFLLTAHPTICKGLRILSAQNYPLSPV